MRKITIADKKIVNCKAVDVNQLVPIKYKWAWEHYQNENANHWLPTEISMQRDIELWKSPNGLTDDERLVIKRNLGFFSTAESLVANNIVLAIFKYITNPECRQYLLRQAYTEAIHTETFNYITESLNLDQSEIFNMYHEVSSIRNKDVFVMSLTDKILEPNFNTDSIEGLQDFVRNLVGFYVIMEGILFYSGFAMMLSFHRQNRMIGIGEQFQLVMRDEATHLNFGIDAINTIKEENPSVWTDSFKAHIYQMVRDAVYFEIEYAKACLPNGVLGLNSSMFDSYVKHIADRRLERIGLQAIYNTNNPFSWLSETIDLGKEKNFFETRVTEYQKGAGLSWD
jgi:ribonucleoside-diphosphate reductase beta chain